MMRCLIFLTPYSNEEAFLQRTVVLIGAVFIGFHERWGVLQCTVVLIGAVFIGFHERWGVFATYSSNNRSPLPPYFSTELPIRPAVHSSTVRFVIFFIAMWLTPRPTRPSNQQAVKLRLDEFIDFWVFRCSAEPGGEKLYPPPLTFKPSECHIYKKVPHRASMTRFYFRRC